MRSRVRAAAVTATSLVLALGLTGCGSNHHQTVPTTAPTTSVAPSSTTQPDTGPYDWTRADSSALALGGGASSTLASIVTPVGGSPWIVAGTRTAPGGSTTATIWTSADGSSWSSTPLTGSHVAS